MGNAILAALIVTIPVCLVDYFLFGGQFRDAFVLYLTSRG